MRNREYWKHTVVILVSILSLTGCGFKDIDKRLFAVTIGVDAAKDSSKKYLISLKFAIPSASKEQPNQFTVVSQEADSMSEAIRAIKTKVDKEIDFSHNKAIIFSQEVAQGEGNAGIYYWLSRRRDIQQIAWLAVSRSTALEALKVKPKFEHLPSNSIFLALGRDGSETPYVISEFLFDFKKRLIEKGLDPMLPVIEPQKEIFEINTVGLFNKSRLQLILSQEETKFLNYFLNQQEKSALWANKGKTTFTIDTNKVKTKYWIRTPKGKQPYIDVQITIKGTIEETSQKIYNSQLSIYEKTAAKQVEQQMKALLEKIQSANLDPIGFGLHYRARHFSKNDWEEWKKIYPNIKFKVKAKVQISDTGLIE